MALSHASAPATGAQGGYRAGVPRLVLTAAWLAAAAVHLAGSAASRLSIWPLGYLFLTVLALGSLLHRAVTAPKGTRRPWLLLAAGVMLDVPSIAMAILQGHGYAGAWAMALFSAFSTATGFLILAGILSFPQSRERRGMGPRRILDALVFAASLLFLVWMMGVQGSVRLAGQDHQIGLRVFVAYLNAALLGGGVVYMTAYQPSRLRGPLGWVSASAVAWVMAISCWAVTGLPPVVAREGWAVLIGLIPLCQGLAAWAGGAEGQDEPWSEREQTLSSLLPYLPVTLAILVLGAFLAWAPGRITREASAIFLVIVVLLLARMFLAIRDLRQARSVLEVRVEQRTRALEQAQTILYRTERMNTLATLGAGLTHDLNNLLSVIGNVAGMMALKLEDGQAPTQEDLQQIMGASERAGRLTQRLMAFGRSGPDVVTVPAVDLTATLEGTQELLRMLLPRGIALTCRLQDPGAKVRIEASVFEQILVNLVGNAKDAMPGGGGIELRLQPGTLPDGAPAAVLEVQDTGPGIPQELQETIFEAFFTTKPVGKGTGLGLASVRTQMEALGGTVSVASGAGQGTCFRLSFPLG